MLSKSIAPAGFHNDVWNCYHLGNILYDIDDADADADADADVDADADADPHADADDDADSADAHYVDAAVQVTTHIVAQSYPLKCYRHVSYRWT